MAQNMISAESKRKMRAVAIGCSAVAVGLLCLDPRPASAQDASPSPANTVASADYVSVLKQKIQTRGDLPPADQDQLVRECESWIQADFAHKEAANNTAAKLALFERGLDGTMTLPRLGIDRDPAKFTARKVAFCRAELHLAIKAFFNSRPVPPEEAKTLNDQLAALNQLYQTKVSEQFPDFARIAGPKAVESIVKARIDEMRVSLASVFAPGIQRISVPRFDAQMAGKLPAVKNPFRDVPLQTLEKLKDPNLSDELRKTFEAHYTSMVGGQIQNSVSTWAADVVKTESGPADIRPLVEEVNTRLSELLDEALGGNRRQPSR